MDPPSPSIVWVKHPVNRSGVRIITVGTRGHKGLRIDFIDLQLAPRSTTFLFAHDAVSSDEDVPQAVELPVSGLATFDRFATYLTRLCTHIAFRPRGAQKPTTKSPLIWIGSSSKFIVSRRRLPQSPTRRPATAVSSEHVHDNSDFVHLRHDARSMGFFGATRITSLIGYARVSTAEGRRVLDRQLDRRTRKRQRFRRSRSSRRRRTPAQDGARQPPKSADRTLRRHRISAEFRCAGRAARGAGG